MRSQKTNSTLREIVRTALLVILVILLTIAARKTLLYFYKAAYPIRYQSFVEEFSAENGLPPSLVYAVIRTESGFYPTAQSNVGARGLMQITEDTFNWIAFKESYKDDSDFDTMFDPATNIRYGTALLRLHLTEFELLENVLCAYHAGRGNLMRWLKEPDYSIDGKKVDRIPFGNTARYVNKVLETQQLYKTLHEID